MAEKWVLLGWLLVTVVEVVARVVVLYAGVSYPVPYALKFSWFDFWYQL